MFVTFSATPLPVTFDPNPNLRQAGSPGFKEEMEKKEGPGATDNEQGYIASMRAVRDWFATFSEGSVSRQSPPIQVR